MAGFGIQELLKCVDREIQFRQRVYPRWVNSNKLSAENAGMELIRIRGVREYLVRGEALRLVLAQLQPKLSMSAEEVDVMIKAIVRELIVMYPPPAEPPRDPR